MADNFVSGNESYVKLGALAYQFNKWSFPIDGGTKKFFAFGSAGQRTLPGGYSGSPKVEGPYDAGNMPLVLGALVQLHLGWAPGVELVCNARVSNIEYGSEIGQGGEPGGKCSVSFDTHGDFTISFN